MTRTEQKFTIALAGVAGLLLGAAAHAATVDLQYTQVQPGKNVTVYESSHLGGSISTRAGVYNFDVTADPDNTLGGADTLRAFCVELVQYVYTGTRTYTVGDLADVWNGFGGVSTAGQTGISYLWGYIAQQATSSSETTDVYLQGISDSLAAQYQFIVWEFVHETEDQWDLATGNLRITNPGGADDSGLPATNALLQTILDDGLYHGHAAALVATDAQDQTFLLPGDPATAPAAVPSPRAGLVGTSLLVGMAGLGFWRRQRNAALQVR